MVDNQNSKAKNLSLGLISGYIAEYIEDGFARYLHDFTDTEYKKNDLSSSIFAALIASVSVELMKNKDNIIYTSFLATGLIYAIMAIYDEFIDNKEVDYGEISYRFLYDASFIVLIMFYYNKLLKYIKTYQVKHYTGAVHQVFINIINTLPITLYFGYRQFSQNLKNTNENSKE